MAKQMQATYTYKCGHTTTEYYARGASASEVKNYQAHREMRVCPDCERKQESNLYPIFDDICKSFLGVK